MITSSRQEKRKSLYVVLCLTATPFGCFVTIKRVESEGGIEAMLSRGIAAKNGGDDAQNSADYNSYELNGI